MKCRAIMLAPLLFVASLFGQTRTGELRLKTTDPAGGGVKSSVDLTSEASQFHETLDTDDGGNLDAKRLPFGVYRIQVRSRNFAPALALLEVRSAVPAEIAIRLSISPLNTSVIVNDADTLLDPHRAGASNQIGAQMIEDRAASLPGRSMQDLVNSQPGWLYEGNAVLHPRGSEYQTQFVIDGIPLTDNRSPGFGPEIEADDVESISIFTAGIPAEYGRKLGGVIEVNTLQEKQSGLHGQFALTGGSFDTVGAFAQTQYAWGKNALGVSADADMSSHYLNPVVPQNITNSGTTGDFSVNYDRDFTPRDRLSMSVRHELSRYEIPNEQLQQAANQLQTANNFETMGIVSYSHTLSPDVVGDLRGMVRDNADNLNSNAKSTPVIAFLHNDFREGYFKGSVSVHHDNQEWKAGVESDASYLHENYSDIITDPTKFDPGTPLTFSFPAGHPSEGNRWDLEQSAFVQDMIRLGKWTVSAGLRWDHYQLVVNQQALSPRLSVSRYFPSAGIVVHASYDRVFQTPAFENILISSSSEVTSLNPNVLRLPLKPSRGDYYEGGMSKAFFGQFRFDANVFRRVVRNVADDDQLINTAVSYPISFNKGIVYGAEGKVEIPHWGRLSGFAGYSYTVGAAWFPVTGGLFLGDDVTNATTQLTGHFPDSQDQRNTARLRMIYQLAPRLWIAAGSEYGSGLPFDFNGKQDQALAQYGQAVVNRINFDRGRIKPTLSIDASVGAEIYKTERIKMRMQADIENMNNRLNVIDFGGLFSGNAVGPSRSYSARFVTTF